MSNPFIGEIRMFAGNFAPQGWAFCNGALMAISGNDALFQLIGTTYGGDGQTTFALPDLQGRLPIHAGADQGGNNYVLGQRAGVETVTVTVNQIPVHTHQARASTAATTRTAAGNTWAQGSSRQYSSQPPDSSLAAAALANQGGGLPHENMTPFVVVSFIISLFGIFPTQ